MPALTSEEQARPASDRGPTRRLGGYELRAKIADGGMAEVHVARRVRGPRAGEVVAIKTIREQFARNKEFVTMFMDEAKIVSRLRHQNVIQYHELGSDAGELFLAMELLFGQSLWNLWDACRARGVRLRYDTIAWIGARVAEGLHYAHELVDEQGRPLDIVHRDVNATNIFVTYAGEIKVIDFGLAKAANRASKTAAGVIKGKVAYMSPEQAVGAPIDRRTDLFALGTTLWELACDRRLFKRPDDVETLRRVHAAEVPDATRIVAGFPPDLWRILERALARDKEQRYPTGADLARDLDAAAQAMGSGGDGSGPLAKVMGELFAEDQARQVSWVAEVSGPEPPRCIREPLKPPSTFSAVDDAPAIGPARPLALSTPDGAFEPHRPSATGVAPKILHYAAIALALAVVIAMFLLVLTRR